MLLSTFTSAYFFGNLASMVSDLAPVIRKRYDEMYNQAIQIVKLLKLGKL